MELRTAVNVCIAGAVLLIIGGITFPLYNYVIHVELEKIIPLKNHSKALTSWEHPTQTSDAWIKFYAYDLQNPDEVLKGGKPVLSQKGPYVYNATKVKQDVRFQPNGTVFYRAPRTMIFNPQLSNGSESDIFTTINVPLYTIFNMFRHKPKDAALVDIALKMLIKNETIFRQLTVHDILWGYEDNLLKQVAKIVKSFHIDIPMKVDGKWGFFYKKNNTDTGLFNVHTGVNNLNKYMFIGSWNEKSHVPYWKTEECNRINGTDGEVYHPFVDINDKMYMFVADLCRSIYLTYKKPVTLKGVPLYRFTPPAKLWMYEGHEENHCFCVGDVCPHAGALNISSCQNGAPVFVSQPHFLNGPYYQKLVEGQHPDPALHDTYIDVEKTTGIVMEGAKRIQLNVAIEPVKNLPMTKHLRTLLYPVIWLDQAAAINEAGLSQFKHRFYYIQTGIHIGAYCLVTVGGALLLLSVVFFIVRWRQVSHKKAAEKKALKSETSPLLTDDNSNVSYSEGTEDTRTRA